MPSAGRSYVWGCRCARRLIHPELESLYVGSPGNVTLAWLQVLKAQPRVHDFISSCSLPLPSLLASGLKHSFLAQKKKAMPEVSDNTIPLWAPVQSLPVCLRGNGEMLPCKFPPAMLYLTQQYTKFSPL